jgi:tetratricopeptide (TPR) repeat protein
MEGFQLPTAPATHTGPVVAWSQPVVIPTYEPLPPDKNPMFLENRVYQGSSGKVYPLPFTDRIAETKTNRAWQAVHLENEFLRAMILPELGGRIQIALDKTNGYDFVYRQNVIKPALVGLAGPWISGGIEFNWPQHHRPSTFMPADVHIEEHADGSRTIWLSEHEPMNRMKGMHGVCLHPGKAYIELKVRLYNRTSLTQTFLWWANVATRVHEKYQSFFPPDVYYVADHAKRAMSAFPLCRGFYYGVDYAARARNGVPADQQPRMFVPPGTYAPNDLAWYANIPVPTSYMCMGTSEDFFGGYDHAAEAGIVHVANHHESPGKKQWTWGNHEFGYAWDRNLTDADGPYIELMAGVYTDNQPDFSFLHPYETRTFSQYWYPIQKIGPAQKANLHAAVSLTVAEGNARVGVSVSAVIENANILLMSGNSKVAEWTGDLAPGKPLVRETNAAADLRVSVRRPDGSLVIEYQPQTPGKQDVPPAATEPALPEDVRTNEELYLIGLHLEQYRHATRSPTLYWQEALRRDDGDARCNNAMGLWRLRRGEFAAAEGHFRKAIARLTERNPNPLDGEPYYNLGVALRWQERDLEAYAAFYKSTWNYAWQSAAFYALAELDCRRADWPTALEHLDRSLKVNGDHLKAHNLRTIVLRKIGQQARTHDIDALDFWAAHLAGRKLNCDTQVLLDISLDYAAAGLWQEAADILTGAPADAGTGPLVEYYLAYFAQKSGRDAAEHLKNAAAASPDYCFPSRLEEMGILQTAILANLRDARAPYYLGNFLYDRRRHADAIAAWEQSAELDGSFPIVWRNLGIGYHNVLHDAAKARTAYDRAAAAGPTDARIWYERDQLHKRLGDEPRDRLARIESRLDLVDQRDDFSVELAALYNQTARHDEALKIISQRRFQPWEGGEGQALGQHVRTHLALGKKSLSAGDAPAAKQHFQAAANVPENLCEARHLLANQSDVFCWLGEACQRTGDAKEAARFWNIAAASGGDSQEMRIRSFSEMTYYRALALNKLGRNQESQDILRSLLAYAEQLENTPAKIDYFATSLPTMLIFDDNLQLRQTITATFLKAQAHLGLGDEKQAGALLKQVLKMDGNHAMAADLLAESAK